VQIEPMKSTLKPPGTKRLQLGCDELLSKFAFTCSLRRYIEANTIFPDKARRLVATMAGAYPRPLFSST